MESKLFTRDGADIRMGPSFREAKGLENRTRANALFISVCGHFDVDAASPLFDWFAAFNVVSGLDDEGSAHVTISMLQHDDYRSHAQEALRRLDLGFESVRVVPAAGEVGGDGLAATGSGLRGAQDVSVSTLHAVEGTAELVAFDLLEDESEGTQKIFALIGPILDTLEGGKTLVVDEFDARLHTALGRRLVEMFHDPELNRHGAQLVLLTHDTNLLDRSLFRRDQIWFVEKGPAQNSRLVSLAEFKGVRNDMDFQKNYLAGRFGALPHLRAFDSLVEWAADE